MKTIAIERIKIENEDLIRIHFKYDQEIIADLKKVPDVKWSPDRKYWYMPSKEHPTTYLRKSLPSKYRITYKKEISRSHTRLKVQYIYYQEIPSEDRIYLKFDYDLKIVDIIKTLDEYYWHRGRKIWSIKGGKNNLWTFIEAMLSQSIKPLPAEIYRDSKPRREPNPFKVENSELPEKLMNYMILRNYSERTINIYKGHISGFLKALSDAEIQNITPEKISEFVRTVMSETNYSRSYQNQMINAIKLYYRVMQNRTFDSIDIPRPRKEKKHPIVLSRDEIVLIIENTYNLKHRTIISLIYGTGVRLAESVNITLGDIDNHRRLIHIRAGKGKKDRIVPLPKFLTGLIENYIKQYKPLNYLFEGWNNHQYSPRSVQALFKKALARANITKRASVHTLRHTFATHAIEDGFNIRLVQEILGHRNIKTTEIYTHISNTSILSVQSPIDKLGLRSS